MIFQELCLQKKEKRKKELEKVRKIRSRATSVLTLRRKNVVFFNSALVIVVFVVFTAAVLVVVVIAIKERRCKHALSLPDDPDHFASLFDESVSKACGLLLG